MSVGTSVSGLVLDDGEVLGQNQKSISTSSENELITNHKRLEHQEVFKDLVNFLN